MPATTSPISKSGSGDLKKMIATPETAMPALAIMSLVVKIHEACRLTASFRRSEEHTSELQSLMRISYAVICLKKKNKKQIPKHKQNKHKTTVLYVLYKNNETTNNVNKNQDK